MDDPALTPFIPPESWCPKCLADAPDAFGTFLAYCTNCRAIQDLIT